MTRLGDHLYGQQTGRVRYELFPSDDHDFFLKAANQRLSFVTDSQAATSRVIVNLDGIELVGARADEATAQAVESFAQTRQAANAPIQGSSEVVRRLIEELRGDPDYTRMSPLLARAVRQTLPTLQEELSRLGKLEATDFIGVGSRGEDVYIAHFARGDAEWRIMGRRT